MIVGITGTLGAGKGTVVDYLVSKKGFTHYSARNFIVEEVERRGLPVDRDSMTEVANDLRKTHGASHIVWQLLERANKAGGNAVIESIRTEGEAELLKSQGAKLLTIDADPKLRYERVVLRGSVTDKIDFDTFIAQEEREMQSDDPTKQNIRKVIALADYQLTNNGTIEELQEQIEEVFKN